MYARVTTVDGNPGRIDELIMAVTQTVEPLVRQQPGSFGLAMFINREKGRVAVTTAWASEAAQAASEAASMGRGREIASCAAVVTMMPRGGLE